MDYHRSELHTSIIPESTVNQEQEEEVF
jgi:hypothetical protein